MLIFRSICRSNGAWAAAIALSLMSCTDLEIVQDTKSEEASESKKETPSSISLSSSTFSYSAGSNVSIIPTISSSVTKVTISPALTNGLTLDSSTGKISGTAMGTLTSTQFKLTASNAGGHSSEVTFNLSITAGAASQISFSVGPTGMSGNTCTAFQLSLKDAGGNSASNASGSTWVIPLSATGSLGLYGSADSTCAGATITQVSVPSGQGQIGFYVKDSAFETATITANGTSLGLGTKSHSISVLDMKLAYSGAGVSITSVPAGLCDTLTFKAWGGGGGGGRNYVGGGGGYITAKFPRTSLTFPLTIHVGGGGSATTYEGSPWRGAPGGYGGGGGGGMHNPSGTNYYGGGGGGRTAVFDNSGGNILLIAGGGGGGGGITSPGGGGGGGSATGTWGGAGAAVDANFIGTGTAGTGVSSGGNGGASGTPAAAGTGGTSTGSCTSNGGSPTAWGSYGGSCVGIGGYGGHGANLGGGGGSGGGTGSGYSGTGAAAGASGGGGGGGSGAGGGGGGYAGGAGGGYGYSGGYIASGGGGGSSYAAATAISGSVTSIQASGQTVANASDSTYTAGVGTGGATWTAGGNGALVLQCSP